MTKVIQIITRLDKGGSAELVLQTCAKLVDLNYQVILIAGRTTHAPFDPRQYSRQNGFKIQFVNSLVRNINPIKDIVALYKLTKLLRHEKPDILHTNSSKAGFIGRLAGKLAGINKIFHSPHGHIFYGYYSPLVTKIFILMEKFAALFSTNIFNLTEKGRREHISKNIAPPEKFIVSSCGIDLAPFGRFSPRSFPRGQQQILWAGRFAPIKNPGMVLKLAKATGDKNYQFRMVGDGELYPKIVEQAQNLNLDNIVFPGYSENLITEFKKADIFIITSKNEGFGRVIIEAMAAGLPVIATDVGGISEILKNKENGLLIPPNDHLAMARAIEQLFSDKLLYEAISRNNISHSKKYSVRNYVMNMVKYYR
ncbi:MAG: glycosyltransferase family 4 protein [Fidelibacterota bacterium]